MSIKEKCIRILNPSLRIFFIVSLGIFFLYIIISNLLKESDYLISFLLIPLGLVLLYGIVSLVITEIIRIQTFIAEKGQLHYTRREMSSLFIRSYLVVLFGLFLAILYSANIKTNTDSSSLFLFCIIDGMLTIYAIGSIVKGEQLREVNIRRIESENALLKSQLNPHFLYNTLNNIDALIWLNQENASNAVVKLSSLMRYMTYQGNLRYVPLHDEAVHLKEYIELQQLRLQHPEAVQLTIDIRNEHLLIAPMLLMPFIENIFKHTSSKDAPGEIKIYLSGDNNQIILNTSNPILETSSNSKPKQSDEGVGLKVVRRRLKLLYPHNHVLDIHIQNNYYMVSLQIRVKNG